ncbi:SWIM zinc finger family protein [Nocardioides sp.]|uniref:SWIM zinc finger family protein n=1 Tax=Nocardioides sp. TaxID=35761 RepID=UPI0039E2B57D
MSSWYPPPAKPRPVADGLKARSRRGKIAQSWWSQRFIDVVESMGMGGRLQRGRRYARQGQVVALDVDAGAVTAIVQGSRVRPYKVRIGAVAFGKEEWARVEQELADSAWYTAKLLAGEMPADIEELFAGLGLPLFPATIRELSLDCSCPDPEVPCKHLAAVFYLLAERFDEDPFAILGWRGRQREDLLANLQAARSGAVAADLAERPGIPLEDCLDSFFEVQGGLPRPPIPAVPADQVLDDLPDTGLSLRGHEVRDLLRPAYRIFGSPGDPSSG